MASWAYADPLATATSSVSVALNSSNYTNPLFCGDGSCNNSETCSSCSADCGACQTCGDGTCSETESCSSCTTDCGACPSPPPPSTGSSSGSSGSGWICDEWSECVDSETRRVCYKPNNKDINFTSGKSCTMGEDTNAGDDSSGLPPVEEIEVDPEVIPEEIPPEPQEEIAEEEEKSFIGLFIFIAICMVAALAYWFYVRSKSKEEEEETPPQEPEVAQEEEQVQQEELPEPQEQPESEEPAMDPTAP